MKIFLLQLAITILVVLCSQPTPFCRDDLVKLLTGADRKFVKYVFDNNFYGAPGEYDEAVKYLQSHEEDIRLFACDSVMSMADEQCPMDEYSSESIKKNTKCVLDRQWFFENLIKYLDRHAFVKYAHLIFKHVWPGSIDFDYPSYILNELNHELRRNNVYEMAERSIMYTPYRSWDGIIRFMTRFADKMGEDVWANIKNHGLLPEQVKLIAAIPPSAYMAIWHSCNMDSRVVKILCIFWSVKARDVESLRFIKALVESARIPDHTLERVVLTACRSHHKTMIDKKWYEHELVLPFRERFALELLKYARLLLHKLPSSDCSDSDDQ